MKTSLPSILISPRRAIRLISPLWGLSLLLSYSLTACHPNTPSAPEKKVTATALEVREAILDMVPGEQRLLDYTVTPQDASVSFDSSAPDIVFVDDKGMLSALKEGKAIIHLQAGFYEGFCQITVEQKDDSHTFSVLPLAPVELFGNTLDALQNYEASHNGTLEPRLSYFDESRQAQAYAFNVQNDIVKMRIYYLQEVKGQGELVQAITLHVSPIDYVFDIQKGKARVNQAFRRLMSKNQFFVSSISAYGVTFVNPERRLGVQVAPSKHPELGLLAQLEYKPLAR